MSEIFPYDNSIKFIPKDNPTHEGIYPVEYWNVTQQNIESYGFGSTGPSQPIEEGSARVIEISGPPSSISPNEGSPTTFSVNAIITNTDLTPKYQWQKLESTGGNWTTISGATSSFYTTGNLSFANDYLDQYRCIVSSDNIVNSPVTSNSVTLNVRRVITITSQPISSASLFAGQTLTLNVGATITSDVISYQWQKREFESFSFASISGATSPSYTTQTLVIPDDIQDTYRCVLTNSNADPKITNEVVLNITGADLKLTPAVSGVTFWKFSINGPLILDPANSSTYQIECLSDSKNIKCDMWGQGSCSSRGGYSTGIVPIVVGSGYTVKLNAGGGTGGNAGGGYAGLFNGTTVSQANALLIAGGAGGGGASSAGSCVFSGGTGGGNNAGNGANASSNTTGGTGGTQSAGGTGGTVTSSSTSTNTFSTAGTHTITIPSNAISVTYEIVGGSGGKGGDSYAVDPRETTVFALPGSRGQKITGSLTNVAGQTLTLVVGSNGSNGSAGYGVSGGSGGSGYKSGGRGGSAGNTAVVWTMTTSGGGGGGSSAISISNNLLIEAGGGGGSGGAGLSGTSGSSGTTSATIGIANNSSNGSAGADTCSGYTNSGAGGGGGGNPGGFGGLSPCAGNHSAGGGGAGGAGYRNNTYVSTATLETATTNGRIIITYATPVVQNGNNGSALRGGAGSVGTYTGGGGGGGYYGGGGGGGNSLPDESSAGGGGSGFVSAAVSGTTSGFISTVSGVTRGTAGDIGQNSRIVINYSIITITTQPSLNAIYSVGQTATMSVVATITSGVITYQWQKQSIGGSWEDILGATSSTYTTPSITINDAFNKYRCVLSNPVATTIYTNELILTLSDVDITITPAVSGKNSWSFVNDGVLILDPSNATTYTITVVNPNLEKILAKMWGQGTCSAQGGYSRGTILSSNGNVYTVKLNAGGGQFGTGYGGHGEWPGGGYAGIFNGTTVSQATALLIAGGAGGAGANNNQGCNRAGGNGGGLNGTAGTTATDSQIGSTGGGGGSQSGGGSGGGAGGQSGSALQGGRGGDGQLSGYPNASGGGGGGGGYFGGGGGGGGNDFGQTTRDSSGGGGGSGFVASSIVTGVTQAFYDSQESTQDPNRGGAGGTGGSSRVVLDQFSEYYTDASGRILILSATTGRDPRTLTKTKGKVVPGTNRCIDNTRWQQFRSLGFTQDYRLTATLDGSTAKLITARSNNIRAMINSNYIILKDNLTDWQQVPYYYPLYALAWDETSIDPGYGLDYSIISWSTNYKWGLYAESTNPYFVETAVYGFDSINLWILPPGIPDFP